MIAKVVSSSRSGAARQLSSEDRSNLEVFEHLLQLVRDRVRSIAFNFHSGCYLVGRPGASKTFTVLSELKSLDGKSWIYRNARMSAAGLYAVLEEHRESVVVLDDIASVVQQPQALQILIAALGGEPGQPRPVSHDTKNVDGRKSFEFRGGVIAISNLPLRRDPLADAVASRVVLLEHEPTDEMLAAFIRSQALKGYRNLSPNECSLVAEFVLLEACDSDYRLDLRFYFKGLQDFRQCKEGFAKRTWQDLIRSSMRRLFRSSAVTPLSRADQRKSLRDIAMNLYRSFPHPHDKQRRDAEWRSRTGKSPDVLYRHHRQLAEEGVL